MLLVDVAALPRTIKQSYYQGGESDPLHEALAGVEIGLSQCERVLAGLADRERLLAGVELVKK